MATQLILKYKDGLLASGLMGISVPIMYRLNQKSLFASQVISVGIQLGTQCWVSFVGGPTMFANMEREAFGNIQSVLFPKYGLMNSCVSLFALLGFMKQYPGASLTCFGCPGLDLVLSFVPCLINYAIVIPVTTKYMFELREVKKTKDEAAIKQAGMKFGILHSISLLLNFIPMAANLHFLYTVTSSAFIS